MKKKIDFEYLTEFKLANEQKYSDWLKDIVDNHNFILGELQYIFVDDEYLLTINQQFLNHDTYTDIITFEYSIGNTISGDVFISIERVKENADQYNHVFKDELLRVMAHGALHLLGYKDKEKDDVVVMRQKEDECIKLFHVEP